MESNSVEEFAFLDSAFNKYQVYFTGENHNFSRFNSQLELKLLTYLHQSQGVKHFIYEFSPGAGYLMDEMVINGSLFASGYLMKNYYTPFYELLVKIEIMNSKLPAEDKIHIHGIDVERYPYFSIYALSLMVDSLDTKMNGGELFEQIKALATETENSFYVETYYEETDEDLEVVFPDVNVWLSLNSIIDQSYAMQPELKQLLGKDSSIYFAVIASLEAGMEWYNTDIRGDIKSPIGRERFMCDEFERVFRSDSTGKFYGQFGRCHLSKDATHEVCYDYYMKSVATRISEINPQLANSVLIIPIFYAQPFSADREAVQALNLDEKFTENGTVFLIDMNYPNGGNMIPGFYDELKYVIICNQKDDSYREIHEGSDYPLEEYHGGAYYGYRYFRKLDKLNQALENYGNIGFTDKFQTYTLSFDYVEMNGITNGFGLTYIPPVSNFQGFEMKGFMIHAGGGYPFGNRWVMGAVGYDIGYGRIILTESTISSVPNFMQENGKNINIYRNDMLTVDPYFQFRFTLPLISLNFKAGWAFDVSSKYWKLDGKMKDFAKTSFTAPYIQAGVSLMLQYR